MKIKDFVDAAIPSVVNDMNETRLTKFDSSDLTASIIFPNGWVGSVVKTEYENYSVAICDYNGYFNWNILQPFGNENGCIICNNEQEICDALTIIRAIKTKCEWCGKETNKLIYTDIVHKNVCVECDSMMQNAEMNLNDLRTLSFMSEVEEDE